MARIAPDRGIDTIFQCANLIGDDIYSQIDLEDGSTDALLELKALCKVALANLEGRKFAQYAAVYHLQSRKR
jgi:hypothetical protein